MAGPLHKCCGMDWGGGSDGHNGWSPVGVVNGEDFCAQVAVCPFGRNGRWDNATKTSQNTKLKLLLAKRFEPKRILARIDADSMDAPVRWNPVESTA